MMSINIILFITIILFSIFVGWFINSILSIKSRSYNKKKVNELELENIELRSKITNLDAPSNDINAIKSKLNAYIAENEKNLKKTIRYEKLLSKIESLTNATQEINLNQELTILKGKVSELISNFKSEESNQSNQPEKEKPSFLKKILNFEIGETKEEKNDKSEEI